MGGAVAFAARPRAEHCSPAGHRRVKQDGKARVHKVKPRVLVASRMVTNLPDCWLPFAEPSRSPGGFCGSKLQFPSELNQVVCDVDIIKGF